MTVVSTKKFVTNRKKYFDLALNEQVMIQRGNNMFVVQNFVQNVSNQKSRNGWAETEKELVEEQNPKEISIDGILPPRRKGSLTEGYGLWAEDAPFDENNYRDRLRQTEKNVW